MTTSSIITSPQWQWRTDGPVQDQRFPVMEREQVHTTEYLAVLQNTRPTVSLGTSPARAVERLCHKQFPQTADWSRFLGAFL